MHKNQTWRRKSARRQNWIRAQPDVRQGVKHQLVEALYDRTVYTWQSVSVYFLERANLPIIQQLQQWGKLDLKHGHGRLHAFPFMHSMFHDQSTISSAAWIELLEWLDQHNRCWSFNHLDDCVARPHSFDLLLWMHKRGFRIIQPDRVLYHDRLACLWLLEHLPAAFDWKVFFRESRTLPWSMYKEMLVRNPHVTLPPTALLDEQHMLFLQLNIDDYQLLDRHDYNFHSVTASSLLHLSPPLEFLRFFLDKWLPRTYGRSATTLSYSQWLYRDYTMKELAHTTDVDIHEYLHRLGLYKRDVTTRPHDVSRSIVISAIKMEDMGVLNWVARQGCFSMEHTGWIRSVWASVDTVRWYWKHVLQKRVDQLPLLAWMQCPPAEWAYHLYQTITHKSHEEIVSDADTCIRARISMECSSFTVQSTAADHTYLPDDFP